MEPDSEAVSAANARPAGSSALRVPLLVALLFAAAGALFVQPRIVAAVRVESMPAAALAVVPGIFALVVVLAALEAWRTARRRGYFRGPSLVMLVAAVAFLGLLLPGTVDEYRARTSPPAESIAHYDVLNRSRDPRVRALVMEAAGFRPGSVEPVAALLLKGLDDSDPLVAQAALRAVEHRAGTPIEGPDALERAKRVAQSWLPRP